ncbi:hypothetical protein GGS23DRAFT_607714 [Durotheca rogersii]|uniref:uncharacterized protein n=1 Tax=Durotheca rogersii TaxID=419775 RepID=UPI00221F07E1|nr:uncharacterized protein GGS23DRAFT_607714 [Durotheca rogersii]KAI5858185.1 hypothetical protein GGS23DRAFT_607714 [Durotheca rogersii]
MGDPAQFHELERAACSVIHNVKQIQELRHTRLSVTGGLALWHYLPGYRSTDNINFIINISTSPGSLKKRLLELPGSPFLQRAQVLFYISPRGREIQVDISPEWLSPYLPESAMKVQDISPNEIPYISLTDLIVFKLDSSGLRSNPVKKERDARDAVALVELAVSEGSIHLSKKQEQIVEEALCDFGKCGTKETNWWEKRMGLANRQTPEPNHGNQNGDRRRSARPHSKSDPSPSSCRVSSDANKAWHYERLDRAHIRRFNSLHSSRSTSELGLVRSTSASQRRIRDTGVPSTMTQPKTTLANYQQTAKRSGISNQVTVDSRYDASQDDQYYTLEPRGSSSERPAQEGYFDLTPPGGLGTVTEHTTAGSRRSSKAGYFDLTPGVTPSTVAEPRRPPGLAKSVTFLL